MQLNWSHNEDVILTNIYIESNNNLKIINTYFPDRTPNAVRTRISFLVKNNIIEKLPRNTVNMYQPNKLIRLLNDTPEAFYWIGYILADGWFYKNEYLGIETKDEIILNKIINFLDTKYPLIYKQRNQKDHRKNNFSIKIRDIDNIPKIFDKFSIKENKTYNPPDINILNTFDNDLLFSLFIGFIDGDGNVRKTKSNGFQITLENHSSWNTFHHLYEDFIYSLFDHKKNKETYVRTNNRNYSVICISRKDLILDIHKKAQLLNLPLLERKWSIFT